MKDLMKKINENVKLQIDASKTIAKKTINASIEDIIDRQQVINETISLIDQRNYTDTASFFVNGQPLFYNGQDFLDSFTLKKIDQNETESAWASLRSSYEKVLRELELTEANLRISILNFI